MPFAACLYTPYILYPIYVHIYKFITVKLQQQQPLKFISLHVYRSIYQSALLFYHNI